MYPLIDLLLGSAIMALPPSFGGSHSRLASTCGSRYRIAVSNALGFAPYIPSLCRYVCIPNRDPDAMLSASTWSCHSIFRISMLGIPVAQLAQTDTRFRLNLFFTLSPSARSSALGQTPSSPPRPPASKDPLPEHAQNNSKTGDV